MIASDQEPKVTLERIAQLQARPAHLRNTESNPASTSSLRSPALDDRWLLARDAHTLPSVEKPGS